MLSARFLHLLAATKTASQHNRKPWFNKLTLPSILSSVRIVLLTNGIVGNLADSVSWRGREVEFEAYDIVRLQRVLGRDPR
jgi:hypothetical protein